jgi:hypothetical protein
MDGEERKIGLLIAAFDEEREHTAQATAALRQVIEGLGEKVDAATGAAVAKALNTLRREADLAAEAIKKCLTGRSLMHAARVNRYGCAQAPGRWFAPRRIARLTPACTYAVSGRFWLNAKRLRARLKPSA